MRILLVEDDHDLGEVIAHKLRGENCAVDLARNGIDAQHLGETEQYDAAVLDLLVRVLPEVVQAAAAPMSAIDKMTVISADGASSLTRSVAANVASGLQLGSDLTGVDLAGLLARLGAGRSESGGTAARAIDNES